MNSVTWAQVLVFRNAYSHLLALVQSSHAARECCGFLLGAYADQRIVVHHAASVRNAAGRPGSFAIPDHERRRIERLAQTLELRVVAVYHSHISGNQELSEADQQSLLSSDIPWAVVALKEIDGKPDLLFVVYDAISGGRIPIEVVEN
jgi:proteasome lid subunit RPN8/RPN11